MEKPFKNQLTWPKFKWSSRGQLPGVKKKNSVTLSADYLQRNWYILQAWN